ncbi:LamB/YcsF family protein [Rhodococcus sp. NPDC057529]|uniref:LamB/YcsF family protein n=1 Tax=Rhodococcus sp. NPDC057529 TaxID=3346158 RepID=UPI0036714198
MNRMVDLVADVGEGFGDYRISDDASLLELVSSANVACGFHAGDPRIMDTTVARCIAQGVSIGAHPGFPDLVGFGRRAMDLTAEEVRTDVLYQIGALSAFVRSRGATLAHVAPHGRLGNLSWTKPSYADAIADAVLAFDPSLIVLSQEGELARAARERGLKVGILGIGDRAYRDDGTLVPRTEHGAVIHDPQEVAARTVRMVTEGLIESVSGTDLPVTVDTVLLHGDNPAALTVARQVRSELEVAGVEIRPVAAILKSRAQVHS